MGHNYGLSHSGVPEQVQIEGQTRDYATKNTFFKVTNSKSLIFSCLYYQIPEGPK